MSAEPSDKNYYKNGVWIPFGPAGDSGLSVSDMVFFAYLFDQYGKHGLKIWVMATGGSLVQR